MLESRVRRHVSRIRRGTRNCAEISAAPFGAVVAERVMRRRFARVPTSLKPGIQRLQAPATVTAPNSTYCVTISWIFHGVYVSVSSIQDLFVCDVCVFVCYCVCVLVCVCVRVCVRVCFLVCSSRRNIINKIENENTHARTHKHTHTNTLSHTHI